MTQQQIFKLKWVYKGAKQTLDFLLDADKNDPHSLELKNAIPIEKVEALQEVIKGCEDLGIHLLVKEVN